MNLPDKLRLHELNPNEVGSLTGRRWCLLCREEWPCSSSQAQQRITELEDGLRRIAYKHANDEELQEFVRSFLPDSQTKEEDR